MESNLKMVMEEMGAPMVVALVAAPALVKTMMGEMRVVWKTEDQTEDGRGR